MPFPTQIYSRIDKNKIKDLRIRGGITYRKLASELCVSVSTIKKFEELKSHIPSSELVIRYCEYFKVDFIDLLGQPYRKEMGKNLADFMLKHDVIDHGTANSIINFYS